MKKYKIYWTELYSFEMEVEASSLEKAISMVEHGDVVYPEPDQGTFVDESICIDYEFTKEQND